MVLVDARRAPRIGIIRTAFLPDATCSIMNRPAHNRSSSSKASSMAINGLRSGLLSASKQIKGTYQNVAQSVNTVRDDRATTGPKGSFIGQIKAQITHDRSKRREDEERGTQRLALFPGWAVRRFEAGDRTTGDGEHLDRIL